MINLTPFNGGTVNSGLQQASIKYATAALVAALAFSATGHFNKPGSVDAYASATVGSSGLVERRALAEAAGSGSFSADAVRIRAWGATFTAGATFVPYIETLVEGGVTEFSASAHASAETDAQYGEGHFSADAALAGTATRVRTISLRDTVGRATGEAIVSSVLITRYATVDSPLLTTARFRAEGTYRASGATFSEHDAFAYPQSRASCSAVGDVYLSAVGFRGLASAAANLHQILKARASTTASSLASAEAVRYVLSTAAAAAGSTILSAELTRYVSAASLAASSVSMGAVAPKIRHASAARFSVESFFESGVAGRTTRGPTTQLAASATASATAIRSVLPSAVMHGEARTAGVSVSDADAQASFLPTGVFVADGVRYALAESVTGGVIASVAMSAEGVRGALVTAVFAVSASADASPRTFNAFVECSAEATSVAARPGATLLVAEGASFTHSVTLASAATRVRTESAQMGVNSAFTAYWCEVRQSYTFAQVDAAGVAESTPGASRISLADVGALGEGRFFGFGNTRSSYAFGEAEAAAHSYIYAAAIQAVAHHAEASAIAEASVSVDALGNIYSDDPPWRSFTRPAMVADFTRPASVTLFMRGQDWVRTDREAA